MGALTSKTKEFTYRSWEQKSSIELDDTEISLFKIRSEKLKSKRVRILPINYWISDKKRFSIERSLIQYATISFKELRYFTLNKYISETKQIQYLISTMKGYKKILNKFINKDLININCFTAKKCSYILPHKKLIVFDDLLLIKNINIRRKLDSLDKEIINKEIILLTNSRYDSPVFNTYLFKHIEQYDITSYGTFASNIKQKEIPFSNYNIITSLQGHYDFNNKTIITSCLNTFSLPLNNHILTLTPLYLKTIVYTFNKFYTFAPFFFLSLNDNKLFKEPLLQIDHNHPFHLGLPLNFSMFDHFVLKLINQKFLDRLFLLVFLLKPSTSYFSISLFYIHFFKSDKLVQSFSRFKQNPIFKRSYSYIIIPEYYRLTSTKYHNILYIDKRFKLPLIYTKLRHICAICQIPLMENNLILSTLVDEKTQLGVLSTTDLEFYYKNITNSFIFSIPNNYEYQLLTILDKPYFILTVRESSYFITTADEDPFKSLFMS